MDAENLSRQEAGVGQPNSTNVDMEITRLAALSRVQYDREREAAAERLQIRLSTLDEEVENIRSPRRAGTEESGLFAQVEPWPDPVEGQFLLASLCDVFNKYLALPKYGDVTLSLWVLHTHAFEAFDISPRLNAKSAEKGSGKTTLLDLLSKLCPKAIRLDHVTMATVFRLVTQYQPTLLIDEHDAYLRYNEELRGVLNSGHRRGGVIPRCVGDSHEVKPFPTYSPTALAGIGNLPDTLADRSISIDMRRAKLGEVPARYDSRKIDDTLIRKCARWAKDHVGKLKLCEPEVPTELYNRAADNWRPLIAIADVIGGGWPELVRLAAVTQSAGNDQDSVKVMLLRDIGSVFHERNTDRLTSTEIVEALTQMEEQPWSEWKSGKEITARQLAMLLRPFGITPRTIRVSGGTAKGYYLDQFSDAFSRYLPSLPTDEPSQRHNLDPIRTSASPASVTLEHGVTDRGGLEPPPYKACDGVTDRITPGYEEGVI